MTLFLLVLASCLAFAVEFVRCECTDPKPDPACKKTVEEGFNGRDPGMDGSLSCSGKEVYHDVRGTGYYPSHSGVEGGCVDMKDTPLRTLQDYLAGKVNYVSVAMDKKIGSNKYGAEICIPELNKAYGKRIRFKVVDHGPSFDGQGHKRIDICTKSDKDSCDDAINSNHLTLYFQ